MKQKDTNPSTPKKRAVNSRARNNLKRQELYGFYGDQRTIGKERAIQLCKDALAWALAEVDKPHTRRLSIRKFFQMNHISPKTPSQSWYGKWPETKAICEEANMIIGTIREEGMLKRELDPGTTLRTLHMYLPEYRETDEYHDDRSIKRAEKTEQVPTNVTINMTDYARKEPNDNSGSV